MPQRYPAPGRSPALTRTRKLSLAAVATLGAAALALSLAPAGTGAGTEGTASVSSAAAPAAFSRELRQVSTVGLSGRLADAQAASAKKKAADVAATNRRAEEARKAKEAASRSAKRPAARPAAAAKPYANNLDGWIRESLDIMKKRGIPGTYHGLHRNIIRESSGNPKAVNGWDVNAVNGVPSVGLLQVIKPTFDAYHVAGTHENPYDPVANITAAANYAADRYGSIDNVHSAY